MTECNAIIEANNEIDELKRENKKLNELCVRYGFELGRLEEENEQLKQENEKLQGEYDHLLWLYKRIEEATIHHDQTIRTLNEKFDKNI